MAKKLYNEPAMTVTPLALSSQLMAGSTLKVAEEGDDQGKARAPKRLQL